MTTNDNMIPKEHPNTRVVVLCLAGALFVFLFFTLLNISKPFSSDEPCYVLCARDHAVSGSLSPEILAHPPLFTLINGNLMKVFKTPIILKLWGMALGLGSILLMFLLGRACGGGKLRATLAALLLGMSPLFIQGSLLIDPDNTLITFFLLAMLLSFFKEYWFLFCGTFLMCLWSKMTASVPILFVFSIWVVWESLNVIKPRRGGLVLVSLGTGLALFLITFRLFSEFTGLPFRTPFEYLYGAFFCKRVSDSGALLRQVLQFTLWAGLPLCFLWAAAAIRAVRAGKNNLDMLAVLFSIVMGVGYLFVGGTPFGFPKYQVPVLTLGCWLASGFLLETLKDLKGRYGYTAVCLLAGVAAIVVIGDPIYTLRFLIRGATAAGQGITGYIAALAAQTVAPLVLAGIFFLLLRKVPVSAGRRVVASAVLACFSQFIGMDILQARPHNTLYTYGATGVEEAVKLAAAALEKGGKTAQPNEIWCYLSLNGFDVKSTTGEFWNNSAVISAAISDPDYKVIAYGMTFNTLEQMRFFTSVDTTSAMVAGGWRKNVAGSYEVWTRPINNK